MKKATLWLIATSMLLAGGGADAAKCKYREDSVDKFTKVRTLWTKWNQLDSLFGGLSKRPNNVYAGYVSAGLNSDEIILQVKFQLVSESRLAPAKFLLKDTVVAPKGSRLLVMMADESIVKLYSDREVRVNAELFPPGTGGNTGNKFSTKSNATISYTLDADTIAALSRQDATKVRVETADPYYDIRIHKKSFGDIKKAIFCIQQEQ